MKTPRALFSSLILVLFSTYASAATNDWYATLGVGFGLNVKPSTSTVTQAVSYPDAYDVSSVGNSTLFNLGVGRDLQLDTKYFSHYRLSLNYNMSLPYDTKGVVDQFSLPGYENYDYTYSVKRSTLLFAYEGDIVNDKKWSPHVSVGFGVSDNNASGYQETPTAGVYPRIYGFNDHSQYVFAYQLGLGVGYHAARNATINLDYQYLNAGEARLGNDPVGNQGPVQTLIDHAIVLSYKYNFGA